MMPAFLSFLAAAIGSVAIAAVVLIRLPGDYLSAQRKRNPAPGGRRACYWAGRALSNLAGAVLVAVGAVLSLPGVPGQGLLTMLAGLLLMDFPGKERLLSGILRNPRVLRAVNELRRRFSRPPLDLR